MALPSSRTVISWLEQEAEEEAVAVSTGTENQVVPVGARFLARPASLRALHTGGAGWRAPGATPRPTRAREARQSFSGTSLLPTLPAGKPPKRLSLE